MIDPRCDDFITTDDLLDKCFFEVLHREIVLHFTADSYRLDI
jgi:hypothetical protein